MTLKTALSILLLSTISAGALAQQPPPEARKHSDSCIKAYDLAEYQRAIDECKAAYELFPAPLLLYSIAQANRKLGRPAIALEFYKKYISKAPTGSQRELAEDQINRLTVIVEAAERSRVAPPDGAGAEGAKPAPVVTQPAAVVEVHAQPPARTPVYKKWWLWTIVGVAVAGVGVGLGVGLSASKTPAGTSFPAVAF